MLKKLSLVFVLFLTACGWHFKNNEMFPAELRTLSLESADQYSEMSRILRNQMLLVISTSYRKRKTSQIYV